MKKAHKSAREKKKIAKVMANKACGSASIWGTYQPREPKKISK